MHATDVSILSRDVVCTAYFLRPHVASFLSRVKVCDIVAEMLTDTDVFTPGKTLTDNLIDQYTTGQRVQKKNETNCK